MNRETENIVLLLVGISIAVITVSGAFTRYVKPGLLPWLAASALLLIALALVAIIGDIRRGGPRPSDHSETDSHRTGVWLLVVPILVLMVVAPPALRPSAAAPSVPTGSHVVLNRFPFAPLPSGNAPEVPLPEVLRREVQDSTGSLTHRSITVTGFVLNEAQGVDLGRIVIYCCAADAQLARIHLRGPAAQYAAGLPDNTWLRAEGQVIPLTGQPNYRMIPTLEATKVTRIDTPANPYDYPR
ncbi:TIGR03943 family protein [Mycobacterium sp. 1165178.9]|uniref:TIGR03943 family putative permease subunit n=1 Tax=Mycobacterium sp. 1165178.9 TaxID=1834070 RepID=UPI000800622D|nr:TIGR03943 family protein [Mycobacterium sp. 1165178.9]OBK80252.1 TIGR03943 family protein [Mycobacterium sp. 1165178.9]